MEKLPSSPGESPLKRNRLDYTELMRRKTFSWSCREALGKFSFMISYWLNSQLRPYVSLGKSFKLSECLSKNKVVMLNDRPGGLQSWFQIYISIQESCELIFQKVL